MGRQAEHYHERVNRVLDYVGGHLEDDLSLAGLADIACFSRFHFHRIFQAVTGETLNSYVRRARLERAAALMKASPRRRITDIALETGFAGTAEFSRAFKSHFDRTASSWDRRSPLEKSKICKAPGRLSFYPVEELESWRAETNTRVQVRPSEAFRYVYIRIFAPYGGTGIVDAYRTLTAWAASRGTAMRDVAVIGMSLDDPSVTPAAQCRYDLGIAFARDKGAIPGRAECVRGGLSMRDFDSLDLAEIHCRGDIGHVARAWQYLYRVWLPAAKYEPADLPAMEIFVRLPEEIGWETFDLKTCIPVVRR